MAEGVQQGLVLVGTTFPLGVLSFFFSRPPPGWGCPFLVFFGCFFSSLLRCSRPLLSLAFCAFRPRLPLALAFNLLPPPPFFFFSCAPVVSGCDVLLFPASSALGLGGVQIPPPPRFFSIPLPRRVGVLCLLVPCSVLRVVLWWPASCSCGLLPVVRCHLGQLFVCCAVLCCAPGCCCVLCRVFGPVVSLGCLRCGRVSCLGLGCHLLCCVHGCCVPPLGTVHRPRVLCLTTLFFVVFLWVVCSALCVISRRSLVGAVARSFLWCCVCPRVSCCAFSVFVCLAVCCALSLGPVLRRVAAPCSPRRCAVVSCAVLSRSFWCRCFSRPAHGRGQLPWGAVRSGAAFCCVFLRCVLCAMSVWPCRVGACCCSPLWFVLFVSWGVLLCNFCRVCAVRCCAEL